MQLSKSAVISYCVRVAYNCSVNITGNEAALRYVFTVPGDYWSEPE